MKRLAVLFAILISFIACFAAGNDAPVRWRTIVKQTGDGEGIVTFRALVADGWHLYGLDMPADGPKATAFDLSASSGIKFSGKPKASRAPLKNYDPLFGTDLEWWDANVEFTVPFKVTGKDPVLKCTITFMTCDGKTCRPPVSEKIATPIRLK